MLFDKIDNQISEVSHSRMVQDLVVASSPSVTVVQPVRQQQYIYPNVYSTQEVKSLTTAAVWFTVSFGVGSLIIMALMLIEV